MWSAVNESAAAAARRRVVDRLRTDRELEHGLMAEDEEVRALLEEVDLLEIVAGAAENAARFPSSSETHEAVTALQHALHRWKE